MTRRTRRLIETDFPIERVSIASASEKSIRQEHISTLQLWWARRPLGVCRAALFAALSPTPADIESSDKWKAILNELVPGKNGTRDKLLEVTARLATWGATRDTILLDGARRLLTMGRKKLPLVVDTFAGGGSFPLEALRLGLDAFAGELNPVAIVALRTALEHLPASSDSIVDAYREAADMVERSLPKAIGRLYGSDCGGTLAYFWCLTYACPQCNISVPLLRDRWLARGRRYVAVQLIDDTCRFAFKVIDATSAREKIDAAKGTVKQTGATCPKCNHTVPTSLLRVRGRSGKLGEQLYAKLQVDASGLRVYSSVTPKDEALAKRSALRRVVDRVLSSVPDIPFDKNGVRHLWAMQYGIESTCLLYNRRQGVALLELAHEIQVAVKSLKHKYPADVVRAVTVLLTLTFNRLVMYGTRHAWWQPNGEFPANMFGRQAIPMVWNYAEIPPQSQGAAGWKSARTWVDKIARHLTKIPSKGTVHLGDAAAVPLRSRSVDVVAIDPPYYDSITYAYLADVFYAWMKPLLEAHFPDDFQYDVTPKEEEAIVDRKHTLAPSPKAPSHFRRKMLESLKEARRILKPEGRLLLMYGHKKAEAWEVLLESIFEAGFIPTASWPVHTERKVKFKHGKVAALSTSCLMVCEPMVKKKTRPSITWDDFVKMLSKHLRDLIRRFELNHVLGTDLATSLIAPACALYAQNKVVQDDGTSLPVRELLHRLPQFMRMLELEGVLASPALQSDPGLSALIRRAVDVNSDSDSTLIQWIRDAGKSTANKNTISVGANYALHLLDGHSTRADAIWNSLTKNSQHALQAFFRALSILGPEQGTARQLANSALGRISLSNRTPSL